MTKKIVKLAVIRSNESEGCPFGLDIPYACSSAGELISRMAPMDVLGEDSDEQEKVEIAVANNHLFLWKNPKQRCQYAGKIFAESDVVECNYGSNAPAIREKGALVGSPFFYRHFSGIGLDGLYSLPLGYYSENSINRGMYKGMYSIENTASKKK